MPYPYHMHITSQIVLAPNHWLIHEASSHPQHERQTRSKMRHQHLSPEPEVVLKGCSPAHEAVLQPVFSQFQLFQVKTRGEKDVFQGQY